MNPFPELLGLLESARHTPALERAAEAVKTHASELSEQDTKGLRRAYRAARARIAEFDKEPSYLTDAEFGIAPETTNRSPSP